MNKDIFLKVIKILEKEYKNWDAPVVANLAQETKDPYKVLISTIISLRTKDEITGKVSKKLFEKADNPYDMVKLSQKEIEELIYPAGFYKNKAKTIKEISQKIIDEYGGKVPDDIEELLKLKGVGRKTANLVLSKGYNKPAICVDTHVHRIVNRLGFVKTKTPEETEFELMKKVPKEYWSKLNEILVAFGQTICKPISPLCSKCPVENYCEKIGVEKSR